jgi:hypothetical protein
VYPTLTQTLVRRVLAIVLYARARVRRLPAEYDVPTLRELIYLKCPWWLRALTGLMLPRHRPRWSHEPRSSRFRMFSNEDLADLRPLPCLEELAGDRMPAADEAHSVSGPHFRLAVSENMRANA